MALPFIILGVAAAATAFGGKKAYDGYQKKSEANDIFDGAQERFDNRKETFEAANTLSSQKLERLGEKELQIGTEFKEFNTIAKALLEKMAREGQTDLNVQVPQHRLNQIEKLSISATEFLGTVIGAGTSGAAAGFAVYSGVMAFAAASTGTPIAALSGAAAYNATMAAIGGGSLAAGGWGMAGGAMVLGGAVVAPLIAIMGWAYNNHAEKALENAQEMARKVRKAITQMDQAEAHLANVNHYVDNIYHALVRMHDTFADYFDILKATHQKITAGQKEINEPESVLRAIQNGYMLAAIITDVITTPLFKPVTNAQNEAVINDEGVIELEVDENGINVLNKQALDKALETSDQEYVRFLAKA